MRLVPLSDLDIERRMPIWSAFADTFLDTEPGEQACRSIARAVVDSGFSKEEAFKIYRDEVAPAFVFNLFSPAGEWPGWRDDFARERVLDTRGSFTSRALVRLFCDTQIREQWARISALF